MKSRIRKFYSKNFYSSLLVILIGVLVTSLMVTHSPSVLSHGKVIPHHWQGQNNLRVLTFNVGALAPFGKVISPQSVKRLKAICQRIEKSDYDVILLQEVWTQGYRKLFRDCGFPYIAESEEEAGLITKLKRGEVTIKKLKAIARSFRLLFPNDYGFDTGLMILSRYPLKEMKMRRFEINGLEERSFSDGEFPVNKGVLGVTLEHPHLGEIFLANTHVVSEYENFSYDDQREVQFEEIMEFVSDHAHQRATILGGDFNMSPPGPNDSERAFGMDRLWRRVRDSLFQDFRQADLKYENLSTFPAQGDLPDLGVLDHLFSKGNLIPRSGAVVFDNGFSCRKRKLCRFSDHFGFESIFEAK